MIDSREMRPKTSSAPAGRRPSRLLLLVILIVAALGATAVVLVVRERQVRRAVYGRELLERAERTSERVGRFFVDIRKVLFKLQSWGGSGLLVLADREALHRSMGPELLALDQANSLSLVAANGSEFRLERSETGETRIVPEREGGSARSAEWYRGALGQEESGTPFWTDLESRTGGSGEATAAISWDDGGEPGMAHVAAIHLSQEAVLELVREIPLTPSGLALFPAEEGGSLVWTSTREGERFESATLSRIYAAGDETSSLIVDVLVDWKRRGRPRGESSRLRRGERTWWYHFRTLDDPELHRDLGLVLPQDELDPLVETVTGPLTYLLFAVLALGALALVGIAVGYHRRLARLERGAGLVKLPEPELREAVAAGESERLEFKSTLRWNLKTNKPDRAIETAWLKTVVAFLNSEGGTLLVGVDDDGSAVGAARDGFRNEDKYLLHVNNLIHKHVGLEFARYLSFDLRPFDGEKILVLDVLPAPEPAFLRREDEEDFYVRVGPASRRLPLSRTLEYLKERRRVRRPRLD